MLRATRPSSGYCATCSADRHEVRLRHGAVRRLHCACRRRRHALLYHHDRRYRRLRSHYDRGNRRDPGGAPRCRRPGSTARWCNAATASRATSCPPRRSLPATRIRRIRTSTTRCPAISVAVVLMSAFARRSKRPRNRADRGAENDPRSPQPAQFSAGRSGRWRRAAAEFAPAARKRRSRSGRRRWLHAQRLHPHRRRRADCLDHALCRDGPGHLHLDPDADRRGAGGRSEAVRPEHAPRNEKLYGNPLLGGIQATGNSNAIRAAWQPLREAGAIARTMLVSAAAKRWNVDPASCRAQSGEVLHPPTGRSAKYGELAADAARLPVLESMALKRPEQFRLIGTPAKRLDAPAKVNGTAIYGIDARPLGVKIATLAQSPVFGGRLNNVDDTAAKAVKGVRQIVRLDDAVAVVADHMGAAKKGLAALVIEWDDGPHAKLDTKDIADELEKATLDSGAVAQNIGDVNKAMASPTTTVEATYQIPFLAHATMEPMNCTVHVPKDGCEVWVRLPGRRARPGRSGEDRRPAIGQGRGPQSSDRRRLWPAARGRRRHSRRPDRAACRRPRQGHLDARGRHPARHVPALLVRPNFCRSRRGNAGRLEPPLCGLFGYRAVGPSGVQKWSRSRHH